MPLLVVTVESLARLVVCRFGPGDRRMLARLNKQALTGGGIAVICETDYSVVNGIPQAAQFLDERLEILTLTGLDWLLKVTLLLMVLGFNMDAGTTVACTVQWTPGAELLDVLDQDVLDELASRNDEGIPYKPASVVR